jgi:hypothetical protein
MISYKLRKLVSVHKIKFQLVSQEIWKGHIYKLVFPSVCHFKQGQYEIRQFIAQFHTRLSCRVNPNVGVAGEHAGALP